MLLYSHINAGMVELADTQDFAVPTSVNKLLIRTPLCVLVGKSKPLKYKNKRRAFACLLLIYVEYLYVLVFAFLYFIGLSDIKIHAVIRI